MGEINWIVTLLLGAVLSIPFGMAANYLSRHTENWLAQKEIISRKNSIAQIKEDYERVKLFHENPTKLQLHVSKHIIGSLLAILTLIATISFITILYLAYSYGSAMKIPLLSEILFQFRFFLGSGLIILATLMVLLLTSVLSTLGTVENDIKRVINFDKYEKQTLDEIKKHESSTTRKKIK